MLVLLATGAIDAAVGPPAAVRRSFLERDIAGGLAWRDFDLGGECGRERQGQREKGDAETAMPHAVPWAGMLAAALDDAAADVAYRHSTLVIS